MPQHSSAKLLFVAGLLGLGLAGCFWQSTQQEPSSPAATSTPAPDRIDGDWGEPRDMDGLHHVLRGSERVFSGSQPHGAEGFASVAALGVKTIVSVDGAVPDLELARQHGLRYVHIPIGYDGIPVEAGESLARLVRDAEGPFYIHCHHGRHRGPAAAAVACQASGAMNAEQAINLLERAGTSPDYGGLWQSVRSYQTPAADAELPALVEQAEIESFAAAMARIDRGFDNLKLAKEADWSVPPRHPDIVPLREAVLLREGFQEAIRQLGEDRPAAFTEQMQQAEILARALESALREGNSPSATGYLDRLQQSCKTCHKSFRD